MRLSDLSKLRAVDRSENRLGSVKDVRLERRGSDWEVTALVVGASAFADRLGFAYGDVQKPALLRILLRWLTRNARIAPWLLVTVRDDRIVVEREVEELDPLGEYSR